jgi:hypothetical protein
MTDIKQIEEVYQATMEGFKGEPKMVILPLGALRKFASSVTMKPYIQQFLDACIKIDDKQTVIVRENSVGLLFDPYDL